MTRQENIFNMKITIIEILKDFWKIGYNELSIILSKYRILEYIDAGYDYFNSMGEKGIVKDIEDYMREQDEVNTNG